MAYNLKDQKMLQESELYLLHRAIKYSLLSVELYIDKFRNRCKEDEERIESYFPIIESLINSSGYLQLHHSVKDRLTSSKQITLYQHLKWLMGYYEDVKVAIDEAYPSIFGEPEIKKRKGKKKVEEVVDDQQQK